MVYRLVSVGTRQTSGNSLYCVDRNVHIIVLTILLSGWKMVHCARKSLHVAQE